MINKENSLMAEGIDPFVIARDFAAPREAVWRAWTERKSLMQWFGPRGFTMPAARMDFRPGGCFHYCLCAPDGGEMWGKFEYREIAALTRVVLVNSFSDEDGGVTRHPFSPTWPLCLLTETIFTEQDCRTTLTITSLPLDATEEECGTFDRARAGLTQGWTWTFDQLQAYLLK